MTTKKTIVNLFAAIIMAVSFSFDIQAQSNPQEYNLKAAFLYRFTDYVDWGTNISADVFSIAVLGESAIIAPLSEIAKGKTIKNKRIVIREYSTVNDMPVQEGVQLFQVVFISRNYPGGIESAIEKLGSLPVLIIAEQRNAMEKGALINFFISGNKLKFEVNMKAAAKAGIKISSQLLQHAVIVN